MTTLTGVISYPTPIYSNVPIQPLFYQPRRFVISAITTGQTTVITTTLAHDYVIGQLIRLIIPTGVGARQLNETSGYVLSIPSTTQVLVTIYSVGSDAFIAPASTGNQAQILAIGDINTGAINTQGRINNTTYIPGSFLDISPI